MKWKAFFITFGFSKLSQIQEPDPGPKKLSEKLSQTQDLQHLVPWHMLGQERKDAIFSEKKKTRQISGKTYKKMWKIVKILSQFLKGHQYSPISNSLLMTFQLFKICRWCKQLNTKVNILFRKIFIKEGLLTYSGIFIETKIIEIL